ncbi:MAG: DNA repair protein RecO [Alphaproteobacteria bacterium]
MEWSDEDAVVLLTRPHGDGSLIVTLLSRCRGRHAGLVRGGRGKILRGVLQPGNRVQARWRGRLEEQLGSYRCELSRAVSSDLLVDRKRLSALISACAVLAVALPEREPCPEVHEDMTLLLDLLTSGSPEWAAGYVRWELRLLEHLGYGLDLGRCAATGRNDDLIYVSPRTGAAVSASAGEPYRDRLLALPAFLSGEGDAAPADLAAGLRLTGHFLKRHVLSILVPARERLVTLLESPMQTGACREHDR